MVGMALTELDITQCKLLKLKIASDPLFKVDNARF